MYIEIQDSTFAMGMLLSTIILTLFGLGLAIVAVVGFCHRWKDKLELVEYRAWEAVDCCIETVALPFFVAYRLSSGKWPKRAHTNWWYYYITTPESKSA